MKLNELRQIIREEAKKALNVGIVEIYDDWDGTKIVRDDEA